MLIKLLNKYNKIRNPAIKLKYKLPFSESNSKDIPCYTEAFYLLSSKNF